jgi:hypothetical protein
MKIIIFLIISSILLSSCGGLIENRGDARKSPPNPELRVKRNMEEGRGFRLMDKIKTGGGTNYEFASSNELWRASLDILDFMPLASVNYSGGVIITDWYSEDQNSNQSIKISIRFLTNEIRSDAIEVKVFQKSCIDISKCKITEGSQELRDKIKKEVLKTATIYKKNKDKENSKSYNSTKLK